VLALAGATILTAGAGTSETAAWEALEAGAIALFRHAHAPGVGDPPGLRLDDCATQRNLDDRGRAQARRIGEAFRARGVRIGAVLTSAWCRAAETAALAFPGQGRVEPAFNSFFAERGKEQARTAAARQILLGWAGPGALVVVTHQVNVTALTDVVPASGEGVVIGARHGELVVVGRVRG
jgi:phosphohistidine phosphatase SixA